MKGKRYTTEDKIRILYWLRGISMRPRTGDLPERYRHSGAHLTIEPQARPRDLLSPEQRLRAEALLVTVMAGVVAERVFLDGVLHI